MVLGRSLCVCVCVCLLSHISGASVRPKNTVTYSAVKQFVGFSLKPLHCRDPVLPQLKTIHTVGHLLRKVCMCIIIFTKW